MEANEYYCNDCKQLRLNLANRITCGNCGSSNVIFGKIGSLNKPLQRVRPDSNLVIYKDAIDRMPLQPLRRVKKIKEEFGHIINELCPVCNNHLAEGMNLVWCSFIHCNYWRKKC